MNLLMECDLPNWQVIALQYKRIYLDWVVKIINDFPYLDVYNQSNCDHFAPVVVTETQHLI